MTKPAENMIAILKANASNPMALAGHIHDMADGMADLVSRLEAAEAKIAELQKSGEK